MPSAWPAWSGGGTRLYSPQGDVYMAVHVTDETLTHNSLSLSPSPSLPRSSPPAHAPAHIHTIRGGAQGDARVLMRTRSTHRRGQGLSRHPLVTSVYGVSDATTGLTPPEGPIWDESVPGVLTLAWAESGEQALLPHGTGSLLSPDLSLRVFPDK